MSRHHPSRATGSLAAVVATLLLIVATLTVSACQPVGSNRAVTWNVEEADQPVSHATALERAKPVIMAVATAVEDATGPVEWGELTVEALVTHKRCALRVTRNGTVPIDYQTRDSDALAPAVEGAAAPFGYTDITEQGRGGPGTEYADVASDTMLVVGTDWVDEVTIDVYIAAHHDQCDWSNYEWE